MLAILLTALISFLLTSLFGHVIHWSIHQSWSGRANYCHMAHHLRLYPPSDFSSEVYREAGDDSTPKFFAISAVPLVLAPFILLACGIISLPIMITILIVEVLMGFLHYHLHDAFHIKNHWLYRIPIIKNYFNHWVYLHYLHHIKMNTNFGIFTFHWDKVLGSFWDDE